MNIISRMTVALPTMLGALSAGLLAVGQVVAAPITYTSFTISDGTLGSWTFHNAQIYLTLESDTSTASTLSPYPGTDVVVSSNAAGNAYITIVTPGKTVRAKFAPGQVLIAADRGDVLDQPYVGGRGIGFPSVLPDGSFQAGYPLGIEDGTIDWGDATLPSPALPALSLDMAHPTAFSGRAWVCIGFPDSDCPTPTAAQALATDHGPLLLFQQYVAYGDSSMGGWFTAVPGKAGSEYSSSFNLKAANPMAYRGSLVADVKIGGRLFKHARVELYFDADTSTAVPFADAKGAGTANYIGQARFKVVTGGEPIQGRFTPNQIFVFFDQVGVSVGFGSTAGGRGYPFALTDNEDNAGLVEDSLMTAMWDFFYNPGNIGYYSDPTLNLVSWSGGVPGTGTPSYDLSKPIVLSGPASSCVALNVLTSVCSNLNPIPLKTSLGDFVLYESYTDDTSATGTEPYSVNWGNFWAEVPIETDD